MCRILLLSEKGELLLPFLHPDDSSLVSRVLLERPLEGNTVFIQSSHGGRGEILGARHEGEERRVNVGILVTRIYNMVAVTEVDLRTVFSP